MHIFFFLLKHSLPVAQQLMSLVRCRKMKAILPQQRCRVFFSRTFLYLESLAGASINSKGRLCLVAATACNHVQEMSGKTAAAGEGRGRERWTEECQSIREMMKKGHGNPHHALLSSLSQPPLHDPSISGDTLVPAGQ